MKIMKNRRIIIISSIVVLIIIVIAGFKIFNKSDKDTYAFEKASKMDVVKEVSETGFVKAAQDIDLGFKTSGRIERVAVRVNDIVKAGQEIAKIDSNSILIQLKEAKASLDVSSAQKTDAQVALDSAKQNLADVKATADKKLENAYKGVIPVLEDASLKIYNALNSIKLIQRTYFTSSSDQETFIVKTNVTAIENSYNALSQAVTVAKSGSESDIDSALSVAKTSLSKSRDSLGSTRNTAETIVYRNVVTSADKTIIDNHTSYINTAYTDIIDSQQTISTAKVDNEESINTANADVLKYENQLKETKGGLYQAQIQEAEAKVSLLESQLSDTYLRSPIDARITSVNKRSGETIQANETVVSMLSMGQYEIKVDIYEGDIVNVEIGNSVKINLIAFPDETVAGRVVSIDPAEKLIDGVVYYEVTIDFEEMKEGVRSGMSADIAIEANKRENVIAVPKEAVEKKDGDRVVQVLKNNKIENRVITIGLEGDNYIEVLSGLNEGEEVVIGKK